MAEIAGDLFACQNDLCRGAETSEEAFVEFGADGSVETGPRGNPAIDGFAQRKIAAEPVGQPNLVIRAGRRHAVKAHEIQGLLPDGLAAWTLHENVLIGHALFDPRI